MPVVRSPTRLIAGAMSGTSADGIDVALTGIEGHGLEMRAQLLYHHAHPYAPSLKSAIHALRATGQTNLADLAQLARDISLAYATAIHTALAESGTKSDQLTAIAAHGQTLYHAPPNTIQWLDPALIAAETRCQVISDFRRADCAAGGQGAPLVPFADYILFRDRNENRLIVNIGGIANVTVLSAGCALNQVFAYDTGPGNCISDFLMREHDPAGPGYDVGGKIAAGGQVIHSLVKKFREDPYFVIHLPPIPKSTDGPKMIELFCRARKDLRISAPLPDLLASACAICGIEIGSAGRAFGMQPSFTMIVSGGGTENVRIMDVLRLSVNKDKLRTTDEFGVPSAAKEAIAFALLAAATLDNIPSNFPSCTGAQHPVVLGSITPNPRLGS